MSTILEALKKSEQERKLNNLPTLSNMTAPKETSRWPIFGFVGLAILLLILLGFIGFNWFAGKGVFGGGALKEDSSAKPVAVTNETVATEKPGTEDSSEIVVNVVSFSEQSDQSFAMVNGKLVREGEFVRAGLKVEKISSDKVVLNLRGRRIVRSP